MKVMRIIWLFWTCCVAGVVVATYGNHLWLIAVASLIASILFTYWVWTWNIPGSRDEEGDDGHLPRVRK